MRKASNPPPARKPTPPSPPPMPDVMSTLMNPPKTIRVRICVVVDDEGNWNSAGWKCVEEYTGPVTDKDLLDSAFDADLTNNNTRVYFIETDLELPNIEIMQVPVQP